MPSSTSLIFPHTGQSPLPMSSFLLCAMHRLETVMGRPSAGVPGIGVQLMIKVIAPSPDWGWLWLALMFRAGGGLKQLPYLLPAEPPSCSAPYMLGPSIMWLVAVRAVCLVQRQGLSCPLASALRSTGLKTGYPRALCFKALGFRFTPVLGSYPPKAT